MEEKELIEKIRELSQIKPRKNWVLKTKREILGPSFPILKPILIGLFLILISIFFFAQKSLPGEKLYAIKRLTEKSQVLFVSKNEKPKLELELANKRLEELIQIAKKDDVRKLAPAMKEVKESTAEAAKSLKKIEKVDLEIVEKTKELEENKKMTQKILGTEIETKELELAYKILAEREIRDLEKRSLTEKQKEILEKAKEFFEKGDFLSALTKVIEASYPQP
jgi:uncharacterized protein YdaU (DUF1376 family)